MLHVRYDLCDGDLSTNETLGVEDGILRVHRDLVLGRITNQMLGVGEGDIGRGGGGSLVVLPDTDATEN